MSASSFCDGVPCGTPLSFSGSVQFIFRDQFVIFHGIQQFIEGVGSDLILFIAFDVIQFGLTACVDSITVQINFAVFILSVFVHRKQSDIFFASRVKNSYDSALHRTVIIQGQSDSDSFAAAGSAVAVAFGLITVI